MREFDAVLFDMNGVIVDDEPLHEEAFRHALSEVDVPLDHANYLQWFAGRTDELGLRGYATKYPAMSEQIASLGERKYELYQELASESLTAFEGVTDLISSLRQANYAVALVTGSSRDEATIIFEGLELGGSFDAEVCADDVDNGKPAPDPYLRAAELVDSDIRRCLVLEDSPSGVTSAISSGAYCVAVTTTHDRADLEHAHEVAPTVYGWIQTAGIDELIRERILRARRNSSRATG